MAYIPTVWATGDVITATKLNKAEQGIEDAFVAPEVTAADQGKVLTVDSSGDWDVAAPDGPLIVTITMESDAYVADTEFSVACDAVEAGKDVRLVYVTVDGKGVETRQNFYLNRYVIESETISALQFASVDANLQRTALVLLGFEWTSAGVADWTQDDIS